MTHCLRFRRSAVAALSMFITLCLGLPLHAGALRVEPPIGAAPRSMNTFLDVGDPLGRITALTNPGTVARYARFEATFQVATSAANLQLPYDPVAPAYIANLKSSEDARLGITVNGLFLPPGETDWSQAEVQPAFWYEGYDATGFPTGEKDWHVRFAPDITGTWQFRIEVIDAQSEAIGAPQSFTVTTSSNHGFVGVSPTDSRYFQFSDGTPFIAAGAMAYIDDQQQLMAQTIPDQTTTLLRNWISGNAGLEVNGGWGNDQSGRSWGYNPYNDQPEQSVTYDNRFAMVGLGMNGNIGNAKTGRSYTFHAWVKPVNASPPSGSSYYFRFYDSWNNWQVPITNPAQWQQISVAIPASTPFNLPANDQNFVVEMHSAATASAADQLQQMYYADVSITDDQTGEDITDNDNFNWLTTYDQRQSEVVDQAVETAESAPTEQYFSFCCCQHEDDEYSEISPTGTAQGKDATGDSAVGGSLDPTADTAVLRFQRYYARYFMARWGYSTAVHSVEYCNEGDPANGIYDAGMESFGKAIHSLTTNHRVLVTCSFWSGLQDVFLNSEYSDIDFADIHWYLDNGADTGPFLPYDASYYFDVRGNQALQTGGPNGAGMLEFSQSLPRDIQGLASAYGDPGNMEGELALNDAIQGEGTWTVSYQYRTAPDTNGHDVTGSSGVNNATSENEFYLWIQGDPAIFNDNYANSGHFMLAPSPGSPGNCVSDRSVGNYNPQPNWTTVTRTFTVPDNAVHVINFVQMQALISQGNVQFSAIHVTAPNGQDWLHVDFNEPLYNVDYASFVQHVTLPYETYSGDPMIGRPIIVGETDGGYAGGDMAKAETTPSFDSTGNAVRQAAWGTIGSAGSILQWWQPFVAEIVQGNFWTYYTTVQKFMQGIPVSNGHWRNVNATLSTPGLIAIGQKDVVSGNSAYLYVYNRQANWDNLANQVAVAPVSGSVTIPGIVPGAYTVNRYNPGTGALLTTETDTATSAGLTITISNLAQDVAIKVNAGALQSGGTSVTPTSTTVTSGAASAAVGQSVTLTATVGVSVSGANAPTGTVTFFDGGTAIGTATVTTTSSGSSLVSSASYTTAKLLAGTHAITASYSGDANFASSNSAGSLTQTITKGATTTVEAISSTNPSAAGQPLTITAYVTPSAGTGSVTPTGTVTFYAAGKSLGSATLGSAGTATYTTTALRTGVYSMTIGYGGDSNYLASASAGTTQSVIPVVTRAVATPVNGSTFVSQSVPTSMIAGHKYTVSVTYQNTGTTAWTSAGNYHLGSQGPQDNGIWGLSRVTLPGNVAVAPGQTVTFSFTATAPSATGMDTFQWGMVEDGVQWFGPDSASTQVAVKAAS